MSQYSQYGGSGILLLLLVLLTPPERNQGLCSLWAWRTGGTDSIETVPLSECLESGVGESVSRRRTGRQADQNLLQGAEPLAEGEEDAVDVPFLQVEAAGHGAVAEPLAEQGERQPDGLGQGQTGPSRQPGPGLTGLEQLRDSLQGGESWDTWTNT